jgi:xylulokinase
MGATVLVAVGLGMCSSIEDAKKLIPVSKTFTPNMENKKVYDKYYEVYKKLYSSNKDNFAKLNS